MAANHNNVVNLNTATTNIGTSSYVQLSASSPVNCRYLSIVNKTSSIIILATGASGSEVDFTAVLPSSQLVYDMGVVVASGTRFSALALDSATSSGYVSIGFRP